VLIVPSPCAAEHSPRTIFYSHNPRKDINRRNRHNPITFELHQFPPFFLAFVKGLTAKLFLALFTQRRSFHKVAQKMRVAVIGGGPSGLVTLKYLVTAHEFFPGIKPIEARLFEADDSIGGTFKHRAYEDAEVCSHIRNSLLHKHPSFTKQSTN
jgi:hypothetical protein